jgi:hypothetical protein
MLAIAPHVTVGEVNKIIDAFSRSDESLNTP